MMTAIPQKRSPPRKNSATNKKPAAAPAEPETPSPKAKNHDAKSAKKHSLTMKVKKPATKVMKAKRPKQTDEEKKRRNREHCRVWKKTYRVHFNKFKSDKKAKEAAGKAATKHMKTYK